MVILQGSLFRNPVNDVAVGIINGYFVAVCLFLDIRHVGHTQLIDAVIFAQTEALFNHILDFIIIEQAVNHFVFYQIFSRFYRHHAVCISVQCAYIDATALAYGLTNGIPPSADITLSLLTAGLAHLLFCKGFGSAFVLTTLERDNFYAHFSQYILVECYLPAYAMPVNHTLVIEVNLIGCGGQVICSL